MTDVSLEANISPLEQLRALATEAVARKGALTSKARTEAVLAGAAGWANRTIAPEEIITATRGIRGDVLAEGLVTAWGSLAPERRQEIIRIFSSVPDEGGTRNIYAAAGLLQADPNAAVALLQLQRPSKEVLERVRSAFLRKKPERVCEFLKSDAEPIRVHSALQLILLAAEAAESSVQRQVAEMFIHYIAERRLTTHKMFVDLLQALYKQVDRWSTPQRDIFMRFVARVDSKLAVQMFPQLGTLSDNHPPSPEQNELPVVERNLPRASDHSTESPRGDPENGEPLTSEGKSEAEIATQLRQCARLHRTDADELKRRLTKESWTADLLEQAAQFMQELNRRRTDSERGRAAAEQLQLLGREVDSLRATQRTLEDSLHDLETQVRSKASQVDALDRERRLLQQRIADHEENELAKMQRYASKALADSKLALARSLHPCIHDVPENLHDLPPDIAVTVVLRLEQVIRELERHGVPLKTWKEDGQ